MGTRSLGSHGPLHGEITRSLCRFQNPARNRGCRRQRQHVRISPCFCQASEDGDITLEDDWRAFRARKIRQEQQRELNEDVGGPACRANRLLLRQQNPYLAEEGLWAEPADSVQAGTLLVATPRAAQRNPRYEQLVVLVLEHSGSRTSGVILNRPSMAVVDDLLGWGWSLGEGGTSLTSVFGSERVYLGGIFPPSARCCPMRI